MGRYKRKPQGPADMDPNRKLTISTLKSAVEYGRTQQIRNSLARYGLPKDGTVMTNYSILQMAIRKKQTEIAKLMIKAGCQINGSSSDDAPLTLAVKNEDEELVALLLQKGANANTGHRHGTILHLAAANKSLKMINFILRHLKINIDHKSSGKTAFQVFLENYHNISEDSSVAIVKLFLAKGASINVKTSDGQTVLHHIVKIKQNDIIKQVLQGTTDVNVQDDKKNTVLHNLLNENNPTDENIVSIVTWLLLKGAKVDIQDDSGNTVCHIAVKKKYFRVFEIFLQCQWDVNCYNNERKTVLHFLCEGKVDPIESEDLQLAEMAENCIKKGSEVDSKDNHSKTPLYWAVLMRQKHMVKYLLHYGANPNLLDDKGGTVIENLMIKEVEMVEKVVSDVLNYYRRPCYSYDKIVKIKIPQNIERDSEIAEMLLFKKAIAEKVSTGQISIFHYSAANSHLKMLRHIISYSKNPNISDSHKNTIIHTLLINNLNENEEVERKVPEIATIILSKAADVNAANEKGETPLHLAAKSKHFKVAKALLEQNARVTDLDNDGNTVLHFLCMLQFETNDAVEQSLTELFVSNGCDINTRNKNGMTPLLFAAQSGSINMTRILLNLNAKIDCIENKNLSMPIHLAAVNNHPEIIQQLVQHGADVNVRRGDHKTALHLSVAHQVPKGTRASLENGADTDLKDYEGQTPLHWACWYESLDSINELLEYGADVNVENNFHATPLMLTQKSTNTWTKLRFYVVKLKAANMHVSNRNEIYIKSCIKDHSNYAYAAEVKELEKVAIDEILRMEKVQIAPRVSLADVLLMSATKLSFFKNNEDFQKLLNSDDFKEKFPVYADLVRACYRKGIIRSDLIISAKEAFRNILGLPLPDTCCDAIFDYLDNENLHNLDKAAKIRIAKRKRSLKKLTPKKRAAQQRESEE